MKFLLQNKIRLYLGMVLLLAAALRLFHLGQKPFWSDEGVAWWMALGQVEIDAPIIYQFAFQWSLNLFGWNEVAGRLPSVVFGVLSVAMIYLLTKAWFGEQPGLGAAGLAALSPYLISISQEMRIYSLLGLELLLATWCFWKFLQAETSRSKWLVGLFTVGIIGQYTHCFFIFVLLYFGIVLVVLQRGKGYRLLWGYLIMLAGVILLCLPEGLKSLSVAGTRLHIYAGDWTHLYLNLFRVSRAYFSFLWGDYLTGFLTSLLAFLPYTPARWLAILLPSGVGLAVVVFALSHVIQKVRQRDSTSGGCWLLLGMLGTFTGLYLIIEVSTSAHLIFVYIPWLLLLSGFWVKLNAWSGKILAILLVLFSLISLAGYYVSPTFAQERADWRQAGAWLQSERPPEDAILLLRARDAYYTLKFYHPGLGGEIYYAQRHRVKSEDDAEPEQWWRETSPEEKIVHLSPSHQRLWVVESDPDWQPVTNAVYRVTRSGDFGPNLQVHLIERQ